MLSELRVLSLRVWSPDQINVSDDIEIILSPLELLLNPWIGAAIFMVTPDFDSQQSGVAKKVFIGVFCFVIVPMRVDLAPSG